MLLGTCNASLGHPAVKSIVAFTLYVKSAELALDLEDLTPRKRATEFPRLFMLMMSG